MVGLPNGKPLRVNNLVVMINYLQTYIEYCVLIVIHIMQQ